MKEHRKYVSAAAMRTALEERLNRTAREKNQDIFRLRRQVAFDRFLARIFSISEPNRFVLKGGYALELRLHNARTTKDIDICVNERLSSIVADEESLLTLIRQVATIDLSDFFEYTVEESILNLENALYGGHRFPVECRMAGRRFAHFHVDIAAGDVWLDTHVALPGKEWFDFAGIPAPKILVISTEQQFAEKVHSYSLPRQTPNSRTKDIVDLVLLIENGNLDPARLYEAIIKTFKRRKTHDIPVELENPPETWQVRYKKMAEECGIENPGDLNSAIDKVRQLYGKLMNNKT